MQFKRNLIFSVLVAAILFTFQAQAKDRGPLVRVKVGETTTEFVLVPKKYMQVSCYRKGRLICNYHAYTPLTLRPGQNGIQLEQEGGVLESGLEEVICTPRRSGSSISINGKSYRGRLKILINSRPNTLLAVNQVRMEDYLKGVVPLEMGIRLITTPEDREALKVQAVAARTYALAKLGQYPDRPYDLESTVADQVYGEGQIGAELDNRAID